VTVLSVEGGESRTEFAGADPYVARLEGCGHAELALIARCRRRIFEVAWGWLVGGRPNAGRWNSRDKGSQADER